MEREQAIEILKEIIDEGWLISDFEKCVAIDACEMAIKALEQEPCEDCISRKEIQQKINRLWNSDGGKDYCMETLKDFVTDLPPVTPKGVTVTDFADKSMECGKLANKWILVKERLPEESLNSVIGWDTYRERCVFVQYIDGCFQITGKDESFDIIAWMPLPQPYKETESEDGN